jgi:hypothetical protein
MRFTTLLSLSVVLVALGLLGVACGGGDVDSGLDSGDTRPDDQPAVRRTTVERLLADARNFNEGPVLVRGEAHPRERGFFLVNDGASIWVAAPTGVRGLESGERVRVRGELERITAQNAEQVRQALARERDGDPPPRAPRAIEQTPAEVGGPFLVLRALRRAGA